MTEIAFSALECFSYPYIWFMNLLDKTGFTMLYITAITLVVCFKFIVRPIFGSARSDMAKNTYRSFKNRKG